MKQRKRKKEKSDTNWIFFPSVTCAPGVIFDCRLSERASLLLEEVIDLSSSRPKLNLRETDALLSHFFWSSSPCWRGDDTIFYSSCDKVLSSFLFFPASEVYKVNMVFIVHRNHKAYYGRRDGGRGYGGGGRGRLYTYRYTVTTRMTSALRWAAMRAILMFQ